jgi:hypothetical protein
MLSRALSLATVMLLIGCFAADKAQAQAQNLEAGKSPSQIFAGTCSACHKSPRGLLKTVPAGSLPGFLRQHYTTSSDMASLLSAFMISNGATDTRYGGAQSKPDKEAKQEAKQEPKPTGSPEQLDRQGHRLRPAPSQVAAKPDAKPQDAARSDADGRAEPGRHGRNAKRLARPAETPDAADARTPAQAASERGPDGRKSAAKQRLGKRGRPGSEESPKSDTAKGDAAKTDAGKGEAAREDPAKPEPVKDYAPKNDTAKDEGSAPEEGSRPPAEGLRPPAENKSETAKIEVPRDPNREVPAMRADPVPLVTPAAPTAGSSGTPERATGASASPPASAAVTASTPPGAPMAPAGPPAPPISQ